MEKKLNIVVEHCPQNHKCPAVKVCPVGALSQKGFEAPKIDYDKCIGCGKCAKLCPKKALVLAQGLDGQIWGGGDAGGPRSKEKRRK